ncbi:MAG: TetR/AcrR family transcriptional regulator; helix-turn-helix transcriptional regulator [Chloroflexi bacterium]|nr:TetR/AcrR family transcriptional regulator; helix-turn-helix transcriptional regulator [Chloroflexota bacterium]MBU1748924.1 TetR/AcrR family transcriptional regulator; helix-turn-helix transcriptional regulator [Chloroflexota bacterium]MBU1877985.1 TetR/AcrR family transcriptional regulator; helix-turn-helix transcriptional regulator [Chloroflexota bacterium]
MSYHSTVSDEVDAQILDAAERLLGGELGNSLTMEQLAAESQLSRATLYRRLGGKEALLQRLARERGLEIEALDGSDIPTRILQAAGIAFGRNGLARTTMEQIAAEAGLGVATIYRHFGDRDSLIRAFLQRHTPQRFFERVELHSSGDIRADLVQLVTEMLTFLHQNRDLIWLSLVEGEETQRLFARLREGPERTHVVMTRFLEAAVAAGQLQDQDPQRMTTALLGLLMVFALKVPVFGGPPLEDAHQTAEFIVDLFLNGLRKDTRENQEQV